MKSSITRRYRGLAIGILAFLGCLTSWAAIDSSSFAPAFNLLTGANPFQVAAADLDGDGRVDLVATDLSSNDITLYRNLGPSGALSAASFDPGFTLPVGSLPTGVTIGDVDGDGKPDVIVANLGNNTISILRNTSTPGSISFASQVEFATAATPTAIVIADLDQDGKPDIAVSDEGSSAISVLRNLSSPGAITPSSLDPHIDLLVAGRPISLAGADLDGDGKVDLVSTDDAGSSLSVVRNISTPGNLNFETHVEFGSGSSPQGIAVGDVDGDGKPDLLSANFGAGTVSVLRNQATAGAINASSFAAAVDFPTGANPRGIVFVDLDQDGKKDIATSNYGGSSLSVLRNQRVTGVVDANTFALHVDFAAGAAAFILAAADLDQDGAVDLAIANLGANTVSVFKNLTGPSAPAISSQPQSQTVTVGDNVTFSVTASGNPTPTYQWRRNGVNIAGATSSTLTLNNVQMNQAGNYSVVVANNLGTVTSDNALLTVNFGPTQFKILDSAVLAGQRVKVPVWAKLNGNENTIGFSLQFDPSALKFISAVAGPGTPNQMTLNANTLSATAGRLGFGLGMPAGTTFAQRTQAVMLVTFEATAIAPSGMTPVLFSDAPIDRQVASPLAQLLPSEFMDGQVSIQSNGYEADVSPSPTGDQRLQIIDWVLVGRFAAGLAVPSTPSQYQRADCAPKAQAGNGQLTVADWVQAGRYATGLDPIAAAAGPSRPGGGNPPPALAQANYERTVQVGQAAGIRGEWLEIPVRVAAAGNEHAFGFSIVFDPAQLEFGSATTTEASQGGTLNVNTDSIASGKLGLALALPWNQSLSTGDRNILSLRFRVLPTAPGEVSELSIEDSPVVKEVVDVEANALSSGFESGAILLLPDFGAAPRLTINRTSEGLITLTWPRAGSERFRLQSSAASAASAWKQVNLAVLEDAEKFTVQVEAGAASQYFRLVKE